MEDAVVVSNLDIRRRGLVGVDLGELLITVAMAAC